MENGSSGLAAYWFSGNSFGSTAVMSGQVVVERVAHAILRPLINNFPGMGRRIKFRNLVGEIIKIFHRAEIAADVHGIVEQRRRLAAMAVAAARQKRLAVAILFNAIMSVVNMCLAAIVLFSVADAGDFVLSLK